MPVPGTAPADGRRGRLGRRRRRRLAPAVAGSIPRGRSQPADLPLAALRHARIGSQSGPRSGAESLDDLSTVLPSAGRTHASSTPQWEGSPSSASDDRAEVAQERHSLAGQHLRDRLEVERSAEHGGRLGQEGRAARRLLGRRPGRLRPRQRHMLLGLAFDLLRLLVELDEHADLGPEDLRHHRREDVIHGAERVALRRVHLVAECGDEDDGRLGRLPAAADHRGGLQAVHLRHLHVEQDDREFLVQQVPQRLPPRSGLDQILAQAREDHLADEELLVQVVHHKDIDLLVVHPRGPQSLVLEAWCTRPWARQAEPVNDGARRGGRTATARCPPAWRGSPTHRPRCTSRGPPSWPWRSRR